MLLLQEKCAQYWPEKLHDDITPGYKLSVTFLSSLPFAKSENSGSKLVTLNIIN